MSAPGRPRDSSVNGSVVCALPASAATLYSWLPEAARVSKPLAQIYELLPRVHYHGSMIHRWLYLAAVALLLAVPACKKPTVQKPIVVHLFRDLYSPNAHELDHRILEFQSSNPHLSSGAPVVVQTINELDYKTALKNNFDKNIKVEVIILNSPSDIVDSPTLTAGLSHATDICAAVKACPASVPAFLAAGLAEDPPPATTSSVRYLRNAEK